MRRFLPGLVLVAYLLGAAVIFGTGSSAAGITARIGDRVDLSGKTIGSDTIYLFVTGPGLASNGVRLDNMRMEVVSGMPSSFTVTDVNNDRWAVSWNTARQGFSLQEGIYTVYAVQQPLGKEDLGQADYGSVDVSLTYGGEPFLSSGIVRISTIPDQVSVYINDRYQGVTPLNLTLPIGTYALLLERKGYQAISEVVPVDRGSMIEIRRTLVPVAGSTSVPGTVSATPATTIPQHEQTPPLSMGTTKADLPEYVPLLACILLLLVKKRQGATEPES
jgi:hypothetical protein